MKKATAGNLLLTLLLLVAAAMCFGVGPFSLGEMFTLFGLAFVCLAILSVWRVCRENRGE